jgi:hypothetical protein
MASTEATPLTFVGDEYFRHRRNQTVRGGQMGRKPVGKVAMTPAERQRLYMQRLKDKAAAHGKHSSKNVTDEKTRRQMEAMGLSTDVRRKLRRLARQRECSLAALVERLATNEESRVTGSLKRNGGAVALKRYYDGK